MAIPKFTITYPVLTILLPLAVLALATIIAFVLAIHSNFAPLASLWTPCAAPQLLGQSLPTPLCFAIHFFQAAHATPHARLEQAVIVSFLAGLATITAVQVAQTRRADVEVGDEKKKKTQRRRAGKGDMFSQAIIANLTIPWLLYSLALGALAWQGIIIPAFLYRRRKQQPQDSEADAGVINAHSLTVALSIVLGLFLPAAIVLLHPTAPLPIILFLLFPMWITLARCLLGPLTTHLAHLNKISLFVPPILASTIAHITFILSLYTSSSSSRAAHHPAPAAAILLLELDHAAIFLAVLYWIRLEAGTHGVLATLAATVALGPGAGVCVGWLCRCAGSAERRRSGKATGSFFGALPV